MEEKKEERIEITGATSVLLLRKLARFSADFFGSDIYHFNQFSHYLLNLIGEDKIRKLLVNNNSDNKTKLNAIGNDFDKFKRRWRNFDELITKCKGYWDKIETREFKKITDKDLKDYSRYAQEVPYFLDDLFAITIYMISISSIRNMGFPSDAFQNQYSLGRTFKIEKRRVGDNPIIHKD